MSRGCVRRSLDFLANELIGSPDEPTSPPISRQRAVITGISQKSADRLPNESIGSADELIA